MQDAVFLLSNISLTILSSVFCAAILTLFLGVWLKASRHQKNIETSLVAESPAEVMQPPPLPEPGKVATWWVQPLDWIGLALITGLFGLFGVSAAIAEKPSATEHLSPKLLVFNIAIFATLVFMVSFAVSRRLSIANWLGLRWKGWPNALWIGPCAVMGMWVVLGVLQASGYISWMEKLIGGSSMQDAVKLMRESKDTMSVALMCISASIVAPLAEEIIFRGYLYPVAKKLGGLWIGMVFSSLVFAAGHGNVPLMLPLFLLGMIMAFAYEKTGSLWSAITIHFCFNTATVLLQLAARFELLTLPEKI